MFYLQHDCYNRIFKIKHKLYIASQSAPHWKFWAHIWFQRMNMIKSMVFSEISDKLQKCKSVSIVWCPSLRDWYWFVFNANVFVEVNSAKKLSDFLKYGELDNCRFLFEIHVWYPEESQIIIHSGKLISGPAFELSISWIQRRNGNSLNTAFGYLLWRCFTVFICNQCLHMSDT